MQTSAILEHLFLIIAPGLGGIVIGGGLGWVFAIIIRYLWSALPRLQSPSVFLPWRTLLVGLALIVWSPLLPARLGLGVGAGSAMVGSFTLIAASGLTMTTLLDHWFPAPLVTRLIAHARTLAAATNAFAVSAGFLGGGGLGFLILQQANTLQYGGVWSALLLATTVVLISDLAFGAVQLGVSYFIKNPPPW